MCIAHIILCMSVEKNIGNSQIKSKKRVSEKGEVFTAEREVKAMCDLVKEETERIDSRFLEPACGNGNFLAEILTRKLEVCKRKYKKSTFDYERFSLLALGSIYGVDIMLDNVCDCRARLFNIWDKFYKETCKKECNEDTRNSAKVILSLNIVCGNALTLKCVDVLCNDTHEPIIFSEWTFPFNDAYLHRKDYSFEELLLASDETEKIKATGQLSLFANEDGEVEPTLLKQYITHYRRLKDNE